MNDRLEKMSRKRDSLLQILHKTQTQLAALQTHVADIKLECEVHGFDLERKQNEIIALIQNLINKDKRHHPARDRGTF